MALLTHGVEFHSVIHAMQRIEASAPVKVVYRQLGPHIGATAPQLCKALIRILKWVDAPTADGILTFWTQGGVLSIGVTVTEVY